VKRTGIDVSTVEGTTNLTEGGYEILDYSGRVQEINHINVIFNGAESTVLHFKTMRIIDDDITVGGGG
jgi:hypothetical protein